MSNRIRLIPPLLLAATLAGGSFWPGHSFAAAASGAARASAAWAVGFSSPVGGPIYPGQGVEMLSFTIKRRSPGSRLGQIAVRVSADRVTGDAETASGALIRGCLARWFQARARGVPRFLALGQGEAYRGVVTVRMIDAPTNQDACEGSHPAVSVLVAGQR